MDIKNISPELKEKARSCRTVEELHELAKEEGLEIPDEQLESIVGGAWCSAYGMVCPGHCDNYVHPNCKK